MDMYDEPNPDRFDQGGFRRSSARRSVAALLRSLAGGSRRRRLQQLVWEPHPGIGRIGAGPAFRSDALSQELDRDPLLRACRFGVERGSRAGRANRYFRALLGAARAAAQMLDDRMRLARQDGGEAARADSRSRPLPSAVRPAGRRRACGWRRLDRVSPRSAADLRHFPGWAVQRARLQRRATRGQSQSERDAGLLPALRPFGRRPRQDPSPAGGRPYRRAARAIGHLSDRGKIHVRLRRRAPVPDGDRLQGAAANDRPAHFRRCAVPAGQEHPGGIRSRAQRFARRRARGDRGRRPPSERSRIARRAHPLAPERRPLRRDRRARRAACG